VVPSAAQGNAPGGCCSVVGGWQGQCSVSGVVPAHRGQRVGSFLRSAQKESTELAGMKRYPSSWASFILAFQENHK